MISGKNLQFEIIKHLAVLETFENGCKSELNIVRWSNLTPVYDLRTWDATHENFVPSGMVLTPERMQGLLDFFDGYGKAYPLHIE